MKTFVKALLLSSALALPIGATYVAVSEISAAAAGHAKAKEAKAAPKAMKVMKAKKTKKVMKAKAVKKVAAYKSCGTFNYWKAGKCLDARNKK